MAFAMPKDVSTCRDFVTKHKAMTNNECKYKIRLNDDKCKTTTRLRQCVARTKKVSQHQRGIKSIKVFREIA